MTYNEAAYEVEEYCTFGSRYHATTAQANRIHERVIATPAWIEWKALEAAIDAACPRDIEGINHVRRQARDLAVTERALFNTVKIEASRELELGG